MNPFLLAIIVATVTLSAVAQLAFKVGVGRVALAAKGAGLTPFAYGALSSPLVWLGLVIYGVSVMAWLWVLSKADLSVAYPFVGLSFLVTMAFGAAILNENVTMLRIAGTLLIACGCVLVARSA